MSSKEEKVRRDAAVYRLKEIITEDKTVSIVQIGDRVGSSRYYKVYAVHEDKVVPLHALLSDALDIRWNDSRRALVVSGWGFSGEDQVAGYVKAVVGYKVKYETLY